MNITKFEIVDLSPKEQNPAIAKLLPTVLRPYRASFNINGVNIAVANAIRRTILSDVPVKHMKFKRDTLETDDDYALSDFILRRIQHIPIKQSVPENSIFSIDVENKTDDIITIKSSDIKNMSRGVTERYFNETFPIMQLNAGKRLLIKKIYIKKTRATVNGTSLACSAVCLPTDVRPENIPSSMAEPRCFKIAFISNGSDTPKNIVDSACGEIIKSLKTVIELLDTIALTSANDLHILTMHDMSDTIGNIFTKTISDDYPDINAVTYYVNDTSHVLSLRVRTDTDDVKKIINKTALQLIKLFTSIKTKLSPS